MIKYRNSGNQMRSKVKDITIYCNAVNTRFPRLFITRVGGQGQMWLTKLKHMFINLWNKLSTIGLEYE